MEKRRNFDRGKGNIMLATQENAFDLGIIFLRVITQSQLCDYSPMYSIYRYNGRGGEQSWLVKHIVLLVRYMVRAVPKLGTRLGTNYTTDNDERWKATQNYFLYRFSKFPPLRLVRQITALHPGCQCQL